MEKPSTDLFLVVPAACIYKRLFLLVTSSVLKVAFTHASWERPWSENRKTPFKNKNKLKLQNWKIFLIWVSMGNSPFQETFASNQLKDFIHCTLRSQALFSPVCPFAKLADQ